MNAIQTVAAMWRGVRSGLLGIVAVAITIQAGMSWAQNAAPRTGAAARGENLRLEDPAQNAVPTTGPAAGQPGKRATEAVLEDINKTGSALKDVLTSPEVLTDATKRAEAAPKVVPVLEKMLALTDELAASDDTGKMVAERLRTELLPLMATFGDEKMLARLQATASGTDKDAALDAKMALFISSWWKSASDAAGQEKLLTEAAQLAKSNADNAEVANTLFGVSQTGAANPDVSDKMQSVIVENMKGPFVDQIKEQQANARKLRAVEGKPMSIAGKLVNGEDFSTDKWKGKVVLVDFWASWCGPCKEELPRIKKAYADYHAKGLEILGISNDYKAEELIQFVTADPGMPWPQLFDNAAATKHDWHPVTTGYGIDGIPVMFLIDKKGICRTVGARENFEELIPKLLAE